MKTNSEKKPARVRMNFDVPKNIDRYKARKLQIAIRHLDRLLATNPTQFNAKAYVDLLETFGNITEKIKRDDKARVAEKRTTAPAEEMGEGTSPGVDSGISAENPFTR